MGSTKEFLAKAREENFMRKAVLGCLGVLGTIATILALLVALNIIHPFPSPNSPTLTVSPSSIKAETDCRVVSHSISATDYCQVALSLSGQGSLNWAASGGLSGTQFNPQQGTLESGQSVTVTISVSVVYGIAVPGTCPTTVNLIFTNETNPTNTVIVPWSC